MKFAFIGNDEEWVRSWSEAGMEEIEYPATEEMQ